VFKMDEMENDDLDFDKLTEVLIKNEIAESGGERRKKANITDKLGNIFTLLALGMVFAVWVVMYIAQPGDARNMLFISSFIDETFGTSHMRVSRWDYALVYAAYVMYLISLGICIIAFVFNNFRRRRKTDKLKISILLIGGTTIISFVMFLLQFGYVIFQ